MRSRLILIVTLQALHRAASETVGDHFFFARGLKDKTFNNSASFIGALPKNVFLHSNNSRRVLDGFHHHYYRHIH